MSCQSHFENIPPPLIQKISTEQKLKKKHDSKSLYSEQPATKTVKKVEHEHGELQYVHLAEVIKKEFKVRTCEVLGKYETNVCPREEALPHDFKKKTRSKVNLILKISIFCLRTNTHLQAHVCSAAQRPDNRTQLCTCPSCQVTRLLQQSHPPEYSPKVSQQP